MNEDDSNSEATQPHPYTPGFGVTGKFPQDENDAGDVTSEPASEADQLTGGQHAGPALSDPAASSDQLVTPPAQGSGTA